ncbi:hypothetical protein WA026_015754 [Henosepilachna vigintioctopunctata]|uniref:Retrotransposon gag domain-containing protein n=1 Tax=Henosepilachna vigintioctopunctata TaxID=420089 RepID=A0AAW1V1X3_9CUCU
MTFLEELEQLGCPRGVTRWHEVSKPANFSEVSTNYYKGDARAWYMSRKSTFTNWKDFSEQLKNAFLPLNYEQTLPKEIKKRTQGKEEKLVLYVTRTQNLFGKLRDIRLSETQQISIIRKGLLPQLQRALAFLETRNCDELLAKVKHLTSENPRGDEVNNIVIKTEDYRGNLRPEVMPPVATPQQ